MTLTRSQSKRKAIPNQEKRSRPLRKRLRVDTNRSPHPPISVTNPNPAKARSQASVDTTSWTVGDHKRVQLHPIDDSTTLWRQHDFAALRDKLATDGYIYIREAIPRDTVHKARTALLRTAQTEGALAKGHTLDEAVIAKSGKQYSTGFTIHANSGGVPDERESSTDNWEKVGNSKHVTDVYNGAHLKRFLSDVFGGCAAPDADGVFETFPQHTWLRLRGHGDLTIEHADYYYFKKDTTVFDDNGRELLASGERMLPGSSTMPLRVAPGACSRGEACAVCQPASPSSPSAASHTTSLASRASKASATSRGSRKSFKALQRGEGELKTCGLCGVRMHVGCLSASLQKVLLLDYGLAGEGSWHCSSCANSPLGVFTTWICGTDDLEREGSLLALCPSTHTLDGFDRPKWGAQAPESYYKSFRRGDLRWVAAERMGMGDVILFNIKTIHAATKNKTGVYRVSMDTRVQLTNADLLPTVTAVTTNDVGDKENVHSGGRVSNKKKKKSAKRTSRLRVREPLTPIDENTCTATAMATANASPLSCHTGSSGHSSLAVLTRRRSQRLRSRVRQLR